MTSNLFTTSSNGGSGGNSGGNSRRGEKFLADKIGLASEIAVRLMDHLVYHGQVPPSMAAGLQDTVSGFLYELPDADLVKFLNTKKEDLTYGRPC